MCNSIWTSLAVKGLKEHLSGLVRIGRQSKILLLIFLTVKCCHYNKTNPGYHSKSVVLALSVKRANLNLHGLSKNTYFSWATIPGPSYVGPFQTIKKSSSKSTARGSSASSRSGPSKSSKRSYSAESLLSNEGMVMAMEPSNLDVDPTKSSHHQFNKPTDFGWNLGLVDQVRF